jgi:N-acetylglucosamine malate deacetylase 2
MATRRLLAVWAHPDDEAFGPVGTMRLAHDRGWQTAIITATRGDAGKSDRADLQPGQSLGDLREAELRAACDVLGVEEVHVWRYPDGGLGDIDPAELDRRILEVMREWQPGVVITFGPDGITGHADHVAISAATGRAFEQVRMESDGLFPQRLYYVTVRPGQEIEQMMGDAPPPRKPTAIVDVGAYEQVKREALSRHASQREDWEPELEDRDWLTVDRFARAFPPVAPGEAPENTILHD